MQRIWCDDIGDFYIPDDVYQVTHFRKDGMPDRRYLNLEFYAWLGRMHRGA